MSLDFNKITEQVYGKPTSDPNSPQPMSPALQQYMQGIDLAGRTADEVPLNGPDREMSKVLNETSPDVGPPSSGKLVSRTVGQLAEVDVPKSPSEAINAWKKKNLDIQPTRNYMDTVKRYGQAKAMELFLNTGLFTQGRFASNVTDELIEDVVGGYMYIGAGILGDITPDDSAEATELALTDYLNEVTTRSWAKRNEIIANFAEAGTNPKDATMDTLTMRGRHLVAEQDKIINAAIQLSRRVGEEGVQGAFKSMVMASQAKLINETGADPEAVARMKLQGKSLAQTKPVPQDAGRFTLSIQENPGFFEKPPFAADALTNPGRLLTRTFEAFKDVEDPLMVHRQVQTLFQAKVNRARARRIGGDPDLTPEGMLFMQFPQIAINLADVKVTNRVIKELDADVVRDPTHFATRLELARRQRLEAVAESLAVTSRNLEEEVKKAEARESISYITDLETAIKQNVGNVFEALSETRTSFRDAFRAATGRRSKARELVNVAMVGEAAEEAMKTAEEVADQWEHERKIILSDPGELRWVPNMTLGANAEPIRVRSEPVPPKVIPLESDLSNLRAVLISAERAGEMPWSLRKTLFSDDPNSMVANAAIMASDVMAPRTILKMINNGMGPAEIKKAFKAAQHQAFEEKVLSKTPGPDILIGERSVEELADKEQALIRSLSTMSVKERVTEGFGQTVALAQTRWERGWKEMALAFVGEPQKVTDTLIGVIPGAIGGGVALQPVWSKARNRMINAGLHRRLRQVMADCARVDPGAVDAARKQIGSVLDEINKPGGNVSTKMAKRQEAYRTAATLLEKIDSELSQNTIPAIMRGGKGGDGVKMDSAARKFKRTLKQLDLDELKNIAEPMGIPIQMLAEIQDSASLTVQGIQALGRKFAETFNFDGLSVQPWVARNASKMAGRALDNIRVGETPDWETMPFSLDAASVTPDVFQELGDAIEKIRPGAKKIIERSGAYTQTVMGWGIRRADDTLSVRHLQAAQRANQVDFVEFMEAKYAGELHDLELAAPTETLKIKQDSGIGFSEAERQIIGAKDKLHERVRRARRLKSTIDQKEWDTPVNMANEDIVKDATDADLIMWGRQQAAGGSHHEFWTQNRRVGESFEDFNARVNRIMAGVARPTDSVDGLRKSIARRYLNAPGLSTKQRFDTASGIALTPREAARLKGERLSVKNARAKYTTLLDEVEAFEVTDDASRKQLSSLKRKLRDAKKRARFADPEFYDEILDDSLGIRTEDLRRDFDEMIRLSRTEDALSMVGVVQRSMDMSDGRMSTMLQMTKDTQATLLFQQRAMAMQIDMFNKRFNKLTPTQQELFNNALSKSMDSGDMRRLRKLADEDSEIAGLISELDKDDNAKVLRLLNESEDFHTNLLHSMKAGGLISDAEFDTLAGGYAPHLFKTSEHRMLLGNQFGDGVWAKTSQGGMDLSEMMRQKHFTQWKAIVSVKGGRAMTHLFKDRAAAEKFIDVEYGQKRKFTSAGEGAWESETKLGDHVALLEPLGKERAATLGFLGEGPSYFTRLETLVRDMSRGVLLKQMDRPGWTMSADEFKMRTMRDGPEARRTREQFVPLEDTRQNGPLRGRYIHKGLARMIANLDQAEGASHWLAEQIKKFGTESSILSKSITGGKILLGGAVIKTKQAIVTNKIARSLQTMFFNYLMDSEMFGVAAAGRDFSMLHPRAIKNKWRAASDLFNHLKGEEVPDRFLMAVRMGIVDDTLIGHTIDPDLQKTVRTTLYGEVGRMKHLRNESVRFLEGLNMPTFAKALEAIAGKVDDPQVRALMKEWDTIDADQKAGRIHPADEVRIQDRKAAIEALLEKQKSSVGNSMRRGWRAFNHMIVGDGKTGLFGDTDAMSREIYGRISNINRVGAFYHLLDKELSPEEARRRINLFMQNYQAVPDALRNFGQKLYGSPVVAFPYEQMRIMTNLARHNPEMLLAFMGGFSAANFMAMVAGGLDPYRVYETLQSDTAGFPGWLVFASSLVVPHNDGTFSTMQVPALNWWQVFREPFGPQAKLFGLDDTPGLTAAEVTTNIGSKFVLGNPMATMIYAGLQGRDPKTGQVLAENDSFWGRAAGEMMELFVPPEVPFLGSVSRDIAEGVEKPRYVRSGREVAVGQRAIQSILGVRLRGWLGSAGRTAQLSEGMAKMLGVEAWTELPVRGKELRGFDDRDVLSALYVSSRNVDPKNGQNERILDEPFRKLRKSRDLLESSDPEERRAGEKLRDEALQEYEEALQPFHDFHGREISRDRTDQEKAQLMARAYRTQDFEAQYDRLSLSRKVAILIGGAMTGVNDKTWKDLWRRTLLQDTGAMRTVTSQASIQTALNLLESHLANPPTNRWSEELEKLRDMARMWEQDARDRHIIESQTDAIMRNAADIFFGGRQ